MRGKNRLCQGMILEQSRRPLGRGNFQRGILTREEDNTHGRKQGSVDWGGTGRAFGKGTTRKALGNRAATCRTLSILDFYPRSRESPSRALRRGCQGLIQVERTPLSAVHICFGEVTGTRWGVGWGEGQMTRASGYGQSCVSPLLTPYTLESDLIWK